MKNKPTRHKGGNTFKFLPFAERISNIDVDVFHRVSHKYEEDSEDNVTHFQQSLDKWNVLNLTESFDNLRKELPFVQTLPQLLNKKEEVVLILSKNIHQDNTLSLQPTLELVVALARDLRQEFYPFYPDLLRLLIDLLKTKDADQLEWTFTCLAYLFKFLWRCLVKDLDIVFDSLLPLLAANKPSYINNFAAESFAFVARKVKDKKSFLCLILETLKARPDGVAGCGRLLFEVIRGVSGQFHSSAEVILPLYLNSLADETFSQKLLFELLTNTFDALLTSIRPQKCALLWSSILQTVSVFASSWHEDRSDRNNKNLHLALKFLQQAVDYKDSLLLAEPVPVVRQLVELLRLDGLPEQVVSVASEIGASLLLSSHAHLPQEHANNVMLRLLAVPHPAILIDFVVKVFDYSGFEALVLPHLLGHCHKQATVDVTEETIHLLTRLVIHKAEPSKTGMDLQNWQRYSLDFPSSSISEVLLSTLSVSTVQELLCRTDSAVCSFILLPHVKPLDNKAAVDKLKNIVHLLCDELKIEASSKDENVKDVDKDKSSKKRIKCILFMLVNAIEATIHLTGRESLVQFCDFNMFVDALLPYASNPQYSGALLALDLYLTAYKLEAVEEESCVEILEKLHGPLAKNLSSPFHNVRLLTCHLFSLLEQTPSDTENVTHLSLFGLCLAAERVPATIHEYRDRLQHLQNLEHGSAALALTKGGHYNKTPLRYLMGTLYVNFQLLWEPVSVLIASHAHGMLKHEFWEVFVEQLHAAVLQVNGNRNDSCERDTTTFDMNCPFLTQLYTSMFYFDDRPDYVNYRILLWKSMSHFPDICATRTRDVSTLFLTFLNDEYYKSNAGIANSWNVKLNDIEDADDLDESEAMEVEGSNEDAELEVIKKKLLRKPPRAAHKLGTRTGKSFVAHMSIFSKFKDPKSVYKEPELKKVYYDFLSNKNPEIQRLALDCLMTYKYKFMLPYRENLYSLMDDRTFKAELAMFRVDKESELIQAGHREDLMPIIMRIAYSKMVTKAGSQRGGMAAGQIRRSIVLRFLAGCHEEELMLFVEMAFKIYTNHIKDDIVAMVDSIMDTIDLEKVIPPKRLQSSMNLLGVILTQFGGLMGQRLLPYLLRILLCVSANVAGMMRHRELVHPGYLATLRTVRSLCLETGAQFFDRFNKYDWSSSDIDAVFNVMVYPWLDKLTVEGIHSPTALLKLFLVWSQHPRYFVLLAKHAPSDTNLAPLPHIMQLLQGEKTHPSVVNAILELVERLLTLSDFTGANEDEDDDSEMAQPLTVTSVIPVDANAISKLALSENINYGSALMLSHISPILDRLKKKLSIKNKSLNRLELVILSRVSELVWDSETSDLLLRLLLPMLMKKCSAGDDVVIPLLTTLSNLIKNLADPEKYIRGLAPLFGQVCGAEPRRMLSQLMDTIANRCSVDKRDTLVASLGIVGELNAWDRKWIDQPDFNRRLDAFKRVNEMVDSRSVDFDLGLIVIHTCFHYLKVEKDLSLRDSAGYCLKRLAPALCLQYGDDSAMKDLLINQTVLILVRQGIRDKSDNTYNDVIGLLGAMARECGESHPVLRDLSALTNAEDPEVDFFENLQHLQGHRKARALLKFCQVAKTLRKAPNPRTLTQFILPIASTFLLSEKHAVKHSMVDAAIETVGTVCRLLPWHQYNLILRYYLDKLRTVLEYQKQLVRIVVAILDAFHFDLSRAKLVREVETVINNETLQSLKTADQTSSVLPMETDVTKSDPLAVAEDILDLDKEVDNDLSEELDGELAGEEEEAIVTDKLAFESQSVLSPSAALRATRGISNNLLPQLHTCIAQRSHVDTKHKLNRRQGGDDRDEEDVLRVPIAFAAVKLLQQLPREMLDRNLPGIFMKLCTFLKSRLESVRRVTRQTLQKIMISLGPGYLSYLVSEMCALLTRGFQVHVLVYTIHSVLVSLKELFQPGDVDSCLKDVLDCCKIDLFGATAEEKKVAGIIGKVQEARSTKSYDTFQILAQFITEKCFTDLLLPIQNILDKSNSFKMINKAAECLRNVVIGLAANKFVPVESLLIFMYGTVSESIPELVGSVKEAVTPAKREQIARQRPDTFIIPKAPRSRYGTITAVSKTASKTNAHILVEFGLKLFHTLLKREKVRSSEYRQFIDPVVPIIRDCLDAKHIKLSTLSLQCLSSLFKMELPTMTDNVSKIVSSLFKILHKYAAAGLSKGDNFDLVAAAFKAVVILVRDVKWHTIDADQLKALLLYAEQDVHDVSRQATAFALLKAILARRLVVPEVHDVMARVARMSVTSESANVRVQGRQVFHQYLMDYPLGSKVDEHLAFFLAQLDYELQTGRESALEMLHTVIATFPIKMLSKQSGLLFLSLGARLVNDDVPQCRKMVAQCLQTMIGRLEHSDRDKLFGIAALWLNDKKVGHRRLAAQLCGIFVLVEKADFEKRLPALLPAVVSQFGRGYDDGRPGQYVRLPTESGDNDCEVTADDGIERLSDHHMFQVLQLVLKLCEHCPRFLHATEWQDYVNIIAENVQSMLAHPHEWVRLASSQYLGHLFASLSPEQVAGYAGGRVTAASRAKADKRGGGGYLATNASRKLKSLVLDLCAQLHPEVTHQLADQVVKNLVYLGRVLKSVPKRESKVESIADEMDSDEEQVDSTDVSLVWMVRRMRKIVNTEVVQFQKSTIMRTSVFKWIGAMVLDLSKEAALPLLHHLLAPLVREMTSEGDAHPDMHRLAVDVSKVIKNKVGMDEYTRHMSVLETRINARRAERKKARTREAITQPEVFAKRRIEKQLKKKDAKKRKIDVIKGRKLLKKRPRKEVDVEPN